MGVGGGWGDGNSSGDCLSFNSSILPQLLYYALAAGAALAERHAAVLGLKAFVLSSPYDVPPWLPDVLMALVRLLFFTFFFFVSFGLGGVAGAGAVSVGYW